MGYALGVDLGTTYTAAATVRDGRAEIANLGNRAAAIPSVVLLRDDEQVLTGEAASRRGLSEPDRVAREFKRRVGDTNPIFLGGAPYSAEALMARLLRWVVDEVSARQGGPPDALAVSHPANWGQYKKDLLEQAVRLADLASATYLTEPEAAAIHYSSQERVEPGDVVAVYDLGGGTFDAAVLRKTPEGFEILGTPEGVERLGGIDFDAAVYHHVATHVGAALTQLDQDDPAAIQAGARLRQECVEAKEALSVDTDVSIPVLLPNTQTEVRLTRTEFESMIRPSLGDSIRALRRALDAAGVEPEAVSKVLLVGGSSRIPLVAQMVSADLGRPVVVDADPKHSVALGAARAAGDVAGLTSVGDAPKEEATEPELGVGALTAGAAVVGTGAAEAELTASTGPLADAPPPGPTPDVAAPSETERAGPDAPDGEGLTRRSRRGVVAALVAGVLVLAVGAGLALALTGGDDDDQSVQTEEASDSDDAGDQAEPGSDAGPTISECSVNPTNTCITDARVEGDTYVIEYESGFVESPDYEVGMHQHFFFDPPTVPDAAGSNASDFGLEEGDWEVYSGGSPFTLFTVSAGEAVGAERLCVRSANAPGHDFVPDSGNCVDLASIG